MNTNSEQIKAFIKGIKYGLKIKYDCIGLRNNISEEKIMQNIVSMIDNEFPLDTVSECKLNPLSEHNCKTNIDICVKSAQQSVWLANHSISETPSSQGFLRLITHLRFEHF